MKKIFLCAIFTVFAISMLHAQHSTDTILLIKQFGGFRLYHGNQQIVMSQAVSLMKSNEEAFQKIKEARSNATLSNVIGGIGGFCIGWPIGTALGGGDPNWVMAGIGAGLVIVSIPIANNATKQAEKAVRIYNSNLNLYSCKPKPQLRFTVSRFGPGLQLRF